MYLYVCVHITYVCIIVYVIYTYNNPQDIIPEKIAITITEDYFHMFHLVFSPRATHVGPYGPVRTRIAFYMLLTQYQKAGFCCAPPLVPPTPARWLPFFNLIFNCSSPIGFPRTRFPRFVPQKLHLRFL